MAYSTAELATLLHKDCGLSRVKALFLALAAMRKLEAWSVVRKIDLDDLELEFSTPVEGGVTLHFSCAGDNITVTLPLPKLLLN
jgi:hypothetical protein